MQVSHDASLPWWHAGARLQRLVFMKYVLGLGWRICMKPDGSASIQSGRAMSPPAAAPACCKAVLCQLESLADCLEVGAAHLRLTCRWHMPL